jgi:hypothetical protein
MYRAAFVFAFTGLLRISSVAPSSMLSYDPRRNLRRGDITLFHDHDSVFLRWTKTLHKYCQTAHIRLDAIPGSVACHTVGLKIFEKDS